MAENQKSKLMRVLDISAEDAEAVMAYDKAVDHGEKTDYDLTPEQAKIAKKFTQADRKKTVYQFEKRKNHKENPTKSAIISELVRFISENAQISGENVVVINKERQIGFEIAGQKYELTLVAKRQPKN